MDKRTKQALAYLSQDYLLNSSLIQVINRDSATIMACSDQGVLLYDEISKSHMLSGNFNETTKAWVDQLTSSDLFLVTDINFEEFLKNKFGFASRLECYQYVGLERHKRWVDPELKIVKANNSDALMIKSLYHALSDEELEEVVALGNLFLAYNPVGQLVGMVGSHLEGSIGMLLILPEFRRQGYGEVLVEFMINIFIEQGLMILTQVEPDNLASQKLQEKLGLIRSDRTVCWLM